jgi:hypothetical protein
MGGGLLRSHEKTGRPLGSGEFIGCMEKTIGRRLRRKKPGAKDDNRRQLRMVYPELPRNYRNYYYSGTTSELLGTATVFVKEIRMLTLAGTS